LNFDILLLDINRRASKGNVKVKMSEVKTLPKRTKGLRGMTSLRRAKVKT